MVTGGLRPVTAVELVRENRVKADAVPEADHMNAVNLANKLSKFPPARRLTDLTLPSVLPASLLQCLQRLLHAERTGDLAGPEWLRTGGYGCRDLGVNAGR